MGITKLDATVMGTMGGTVTPLIGDVAEATVGTDRVLNFTLTSGVVKTVNLTKLVASAGVSSTFIDQIVASAVSKMILIDPEMHGIAQSQGDVSPNNNSVPGFLVCMTPYTPWVSVWPPFWG